MNLIELAVALATVIVALEFLARRTPFPRPVILAAGGLLLGVLWRTLRLPEFEFRPEFTLDLVLPPLLAFAAFRVALGALHTYLRPILMLAVGLVLLTLIGVASVAHALVPAITWPLAFALGALLAPPDAVTATTVADRLGLDNRLVTILEGEGLVNDATALVAYQLAITAVVTGHFSWGGALLEVLRSVPIGVLVGLVIGWITAAIRRRVDDAMIETVVSLLVPYIAWLVADRLGGSSVLAVVTFGFFIHRKATEIGTASTRLANRTVWQVVDFLTGGLVFILVGIEIGRISANALSRALILQATAVTAAVVGLRLAWMWLVPHVVPLVTRGRVAVAYSWPEQTVLGWAGMRGVVSLALALAIPLQTASGEPVAGRQTVIMLSLVAILFTLIGQGGTLELLIRRLKLANPGADQREEDAAREDAIEAARDSIFRTSMEQRLPAEERNRLLDSLEEHLSLAGSLNHRRSHVTRETEDILVRALGAARVAILERRDKGDLNEGSAARLEAALDLDELVLRGNSGQIIGR